MSLMLLTLLMFLVQPQLCSGTNLINLGQGKI
ncbi:hypothetical protein GLYMA_17G253066v4 [Glycine max]|nr:hypothetical protein GLYMA_17G253066v4 [Glycine max]